MTKDQPNLSAAYALKTPNDSRRLYADWADSYDSSFVAAHDYVLHIETARALIDAGATGPILDVGAGTGICGAILKDHGIEPIDATDISAEMLDQAMAKNIYRNAIEADLTQGLPIPAGRYAAIVSSGTFTTGHVGPNELDPLLAVARKDAQFAISINARHFESAGFAAKFATLERQIHGLTLKDVPIYGPNATNDHSQDRACVALFRKS